MKYIAYLILLLTISFNLWLYYPETQILADPNDNIFQYSLVGRTNWVWENYGCPRSLSCLPNLMDHNVPNWAEGYPLPFYYSHVPQIAIVSSYNLLVKPLLSFISYPLSLYQYYNWTKYLLLSLFPISVFIALRIVGFSPILAAFGAFLGANISTDGLYGIDPPSYLWRGYGLTSQLYAIIFLPLGIAFTYKTLRHLGGDRMGSPEVKYLILTILFLTLTTAGHLGIGIIGILSTIPFLFFDLKPQNIFIRIKKLFFIFSILFFILSYWIIPILLNNNYHIVSFWDPIWKFNSYGWYEVVRQFFSGEIFDWQRFPIITALALTGFFVMLSNSPNSPSYNKRGSGSVIPFSLLFAFWMLLYFGRTTWGGLIDLIPGMKDFHQHRFVVGVHIAALFLIPAGLEWLFDLIRRGLAKIFSSARRPRLEESYINIIFYILIFIFTSLLIYFTAKQTVSYAALNNKWIYQANDAYRYDEKNFENMLSQVDSAKGRTYAGRPGNWGKDFRLGSTQLYLLLGGIGFDISQFLPETWSPLSENEQNFDEREAWDFDLLNIKYIVSSKNQGFAKNAKLENKYGPFELYKVPATGWFDVVSSPMFVKTDKTNYINLVHLWWNSYSRRWKMHPMISVEKNPIIPEGMQKVIEMKDEVSYAEGSNSPQPPLNVRGGTGGVKNIFSDFPFVFPEATVSAYLKDNGQDTSGVARRDSPDGGGINNKGLVAVISDENVYKQSYSAAIEVPDNCLQCMVMFKMSYHPDWQVKVDGQDAPKYAVFPFYLAAQVTPGNHTVEFTYSPNKLKVFLIGLEIFGLIILVFYKPVKRILKKIS